MAKLEQMEGSGEAALGTSRSHDEFMIDTLLYHRIIPILLLTLVVINLYAIMHKNPPRAFHIILYHGGYRRKGQGKGRTYISFVLISPAQGTRMWMV